MRKMKKMKCLRFLMTIQVECQTQSQMHQSYPPKERWVQAWPVLRKLKQKSKRVQYGARSSLRQGEDEIVGDMVASELKGLSCSVLNMRWITSFSSIKCLIYNKMFNQIPPSNLHPVPFSLQPPLLKVMVQYSCRTRMEEVSIVTMQVWAIINGTVKIGTFVFLLLYISYRL